jgi:hypothetical protein
MECPAAHLNEDGVYICEEHSDACERVMHLHSLANG